MTPSSPETPRPQTTRPTRYTSAQKTRQELQAWRDANAEDGEDTRLAVVLDAYLALLDEHERTQWQPIAEHDGSSKSVLLRIPLDNSDTPRMATIKGFFAKAGTTPIDDCDDEEIVNEEGYNLNDAWFSESDDGEPYAMMLTYPPTHFHPLPLPPKD